MFGIGIWEIAVIVLVFIIAVRPGDLPAVMRKIGRVYRDLSDLSRDFAEAVNREAEKEPEKDGDDF